jgi:ubiquitin-protein ligase
MDNVFFFQEIEEVNMHPPACVRVGHFGGRVVVCQFFIEGQPDTVFANRIMPLQMTFRDGYPYRPPELIFNCRLFHINFCNQLDGRAHMLHLTDVWGSDWSIVKLLDHIVETLRVPQVSLLPKPYRELYDVLEVEWKNFMDKKYHDAQLQPLNDDASIVHAENSVESSQLVNPSLTLMPSQSTVLTAVVEQQFSRLNRVQTMHLSVLYLYLFDPSAYSILANTTGKNQEEIDAMLDEESEDCSH